MLDRMTNESAELCLNQKNNQENEILALQHKILTPVHSVPPSTSVHTL
ncbi:hypothetical protein PROFUN_10241 [Planoprotostelium fungivorum]|uniref:Uncharacterized protein n=1 Tax=Planoprotostelium fungivorum TaxID=1890364 RepID=A0A2P6NEF5_9EUKA|nr:hypothetical protein PROFUN_10241 [Planoprotostelium fungivorum]